MEFDIIIVGAGSAGCVLANRLTENGRLSVLLLEAGPVDKKQEIHIPVAFSTLFKTEYDWAYETEPQPGANGRKLFWPRGKMLGGSSSINAMIYQRGNPANYDEWAALGNEEWGWQDVLPYFKKAQNQERGESPFHGVGGPLNVADLRDPNPLTKAFVQAGMEIGLPYNSDFNAGEQEGVGYYQVTQKNGKRHSTADAYLKPARKRSNLQVETEAMVTRLNMDGRRCRGVAYTQNGQTETAVARREVILCGGAINSPQLLLLSGIGPGDHLQAMGIDLVLDLPGVGQNLQDHYIAPVAYRVNQPISLAGAESAGNLFKFLVLKKGLLTSNVGEAGGFMKLNPASAAPELQFHFAPGFFIRHGFDNPEGDGFSIAPTLVKTESRGAVKLRTAIPGDAPSIDPQTYADERDLELMVTGLKIARKIARARPFEPYRGEEFLPGNSIHDDDGLRAHARECTQSLYHPVGTCKMGVDPMAVVNPHLQVHGIEGLRVVDASIMPALINANTNAPTIMIAEKAADMILVG